MLRFTKDLLRLRTPFFPKFFSSREKEVFDFRRKGDQLKLDQHHTNCLVLHPVSYPNKGPIKELYAAEEAIGLVKALDWKVTKGPFWKEKDEFSATGNKEEFSLKKNQKQGKRDEEGDLYDEWRNELLRTSLAKSSLLKLKQTYGSHLFGKGKVIELGEFIRDSGVEAVFINTELSSIQIRNLEQKWNQILNGEMVGSSGFEEENELEEKFSESEGEDELKKKVRVFDRFTIILQIFAKRANTRIAKLQIELAFLSFLKAKLTREGTTFSGMYSIFSGDLMSAEEIKLEVVSSKQRGGLGKLSGSGETQLEIERRAISDKEAKIRRELLSETSNRQKLRTKRKLTMTSTPTIALIGYTNAGKSALMNKLTRAGVESENKLFQTLSTTSKKLKLKSGQLGTLLDTIGFITSLPHELVESFKCTLEEVEDADIVLHVRDISHPNTEEQKETVLEVLRELKFDESFYTKRMIEVWNKIDLLDEPINYKELAMSETPIIPISALHGVNCEKLIEVITTKVNDIMGKISYRIVTAPERHGEQVSWLFKNANITDVDNFQYINIPTKEYPYGKIEYDVCLDEVTYRRFNATFFNEGGRSERDKIPDDWMKSSKSFFERRAEERAKEREKSQQKALEQDKKKRDD